MRERRQANALVATRRLVTAGALGIALVGCGSGSTRAFTATPGASPEARIAQLASLFEFEREAGTAEGVYTVKDPLAGSLVRKRIEPVIHSSGMIYLRSIYRGDEWIHHEQIRARVGDRELESALIPGTDKRNLRRVTDRRDDKRTSRSSGNARYVSETILFTGGADRGILQAIAADPALPVEIRFVGRDLSHTQTMSDDDKKRIAAGVELARLLRARKASTQ
jgi:hypothetical protein